MSQKIRHDQLRTVLIAPHVSEKSTLLSQNSGQIAFRVRTDSNKKKGKYSQRLNQKKPQKQKLNQKKPQKKKRRLKNNET